MHEMSDNQTPNSLEQFTEQYRGLESMEVTEELLDLCGASIDTRALPLLKRRLQEEEAQIPQLDARGYVRMRQKCEQLVASLRPLIVALEQSEKEEHA
jgi:LPS O-antigen subunit length determinant protein (WzzB/FepE family)